MASYRRPEDLNHSVGPAFDEILPVGAKAPVDGIYRDELSGLECVARRGEPLQPPPLLNRPDAANAAQWRLVVGAGGAWRAATVPVVPPGPDETQFVGEKILKDGKAAGNDAWKRINALITSHLRRLSSAGWDGSLFRDPDDGRLWELTSPHSEWQGGGPPTLTVMSEEDALAKYGDDGVNPKI
jgi:hypothetical protein